MHKPLLVQALDAYAVNNKTTPPSSRTDASDVLTRPPEWSHSGPSPFRGNGRACTANKLPIER